MSEITREENDREVERRLREVESDIRFMIKFETFIAILILVNSFLVLLEILG